jgi:hypothetical protein
LNAYVEATGLPLRRYQRGKSVIDKSDEPSSIKRMAGLHVVLGHNRNATEDKKINNADFQKTMAQGL